MFTHQWAFNEGTLNKRKTILDPLERHLRNNMTSLDLGNVIL